MLSAFSSLKITTRIRLGFAAVLLLLAVVTIVGHLRLDDVRGDFDRYAGTSDDARSLLAISANFESLANNAAMFALNGSPAAARQVPILRRQIADTVQRRMAQGVVNERRARLAHVVSTLDAIAATFETLVQTRAAQQQSLNEQATPLGNEMLAILDDMMQSATAESDLGTLSYASATLEKLMRARVGGLRALITADAESNAAAAAEVDDMVALLEPLRQGTQDQQILAQIAGVAERAPRYKVALMAAMAKTLEINHLINDVMVHQAAEVRDDIDWLVTQQTKTNEDVRARAAGSVRSAGTMALAAGGAALGLGAVLAWVIGNGIARPVTAMTAAMRRLAGGDTGLTIPALGQRDEVGQMAAAVQVFRDTMVETERLRVEQQARKEQAEAEKRRDMAALAQDFEQAAGRIVDDVDGQARALQADAQTMAATAEQAGVQAGSVASASDRASASVQSMAAAAEELAASISEIGRQVAASADMTARAVEDTGRTNTQIEGLAANAQSIGEVVELIRTIAGQTNLLALNATIEAARAGEAGKGFAVVASEVKSLANQTAAATAQISGKIAGMQAATSQSVQAVKGIGTVIAKIDDIAMSIAAAVERQGRASQEIARNVQLAAAGTGEVSSNISGLTEAASHTGAAAANVLGAVGKLSRQAGALRAEVHGFLARVRAG